MTGIFAQTPRRYQATHQSRREHTPRPRNSFPINFFLLCIVGALLFLGWMKLKDSPLLPVQTVKIEGNYVHVDRNLLRNTLAPLANSDFLLVDTTSIQEHLNQIPWIEQATVTRVWPDTLIIHLTEQTPVARWSGGRLLSNTGMIFAADQTDVGANLPLFNAPDGQQIAALQMFSQLSEILAPLGLKVTHLDLDARGALTLQLNSGMSVILGHSDIMERLQRFIKIYARVIGSRGPEAEYVDLRYSHGMAVRWKAKESFG